MGVFSTSCPRCSTPNEVDTDILPRGASLISCWHCATQISISQEAVTEATKQPSPAELERKSAIRASSASVPTIGERGSPVPSGESSGALRFVLFGAGALIVLLIVVGVVIVLFSGPAEIVSSSSQFRANYHRGSEVPSGTKAWQASVANGSAFAPAVIGDSVFVVASEPRALEARTYQPDGVPQEILAPLRQLHAKMLTEGFALEKAPQTTALQEEQSERFNVKLLKGACYQFKVLGGAKAQDIDLLLYESDGVRLIIADTLGMGNASLEHCPASTGNFVYEIRMHKGKGLVSHVMYRELDTTFHNKSHVYALNLSDGEQRWESTTTEEISSSPAATKQFVVYGSKTRQRSSTTRRIVEGGSIQVVSAVDGTSICTYETAGPVVSTPIIFDGMAYFGSCGTSPSGRNVASVCDPRAPTASKLYAFNIESCSVLWSHDVEYPIIEPPAASRDSVFFAAGEKIYAVDRLEGTNRWTIDAHGVTSGPVTEGDLVLLGAHDGSLRALDASTGDLRWVFESDGPILAMPAIVGSVVYAASRDGNIYAVDMTTGDKQWDFSVGTPLNAAIGVAAGTVFAMVENRLIAVDAEQGSSVFEYRLDAGVGPQCSPVLADGLLVFADGDGNLYGLR